MHLALLRLGSGRQRSVNHIVLNLVFGRFM
jgi:hypothetical protein